MKESLTYRRVDKAILNAFIKLSAKIPFEKMTIQNILDEALVSRYTFYAHFHDKYEVAERLQQELYEEFLRFLEQRLPEIAARTTSGKEYHHLMDLMFIEFARENHPQMKAILPIHTETIDFLRLLKRFFRNTYLESCPDHPNRELEADIFANMNVAVMEYLFSEFIPATVPNISESISEAYTQVLFFTLGILDGEAQKKGRNYLSALTRLIPVSPQKQNHNDESAP